MTRGERFRKIMILKGFDPTKSGGGQTKLADILNCSQGSISVILTNRTKGPSETLRKACEYFKVDYEWVNEGKGIDPFMENPFIPLKIRLKKIEKQINHINQVMEKLDKIIVKLWPEL